MSVNYFQRSIGASRCGSSLPHCRPLVALVFEELTTSVGATRRTEMLRKWMLGGVSLMAAAVFLMGTPDSAWARRCCRNNCSGYSNNCGCGGGGGMFGGGWRNSNGYSSGYNSGCCASTTTGYGGNNAACCGSNMSYSGGGTYTQGTAPAQPYSTGYAPIYDGNGNLISNGTRINTNAPAPAPAPAPSAPVPVNEK